MKHAKWLVAVTLVVLSDMAFAQLNSGSRVVAQVPFDFMVTNKLVPAGECSVNVATMDGKTLTISNVGANVVSVFNFVLDGGEASRLSLRIGLQAIRKPLLPGRNQAAGQQEIIPSAREQVGGGAPSPERVRHGGDSASRSAIVRRGQRPGLSRII